MRTTHLIGASGVSFIPEMKMLRKMCQALTCIILCNNEIKRCYSAAKDLLVVLISSVLRAYFRGTNISFKPSNMKYR
jgi:hypothetical protein